MTPHCCSLPKAHAAKQRCKGGGQGRKQGLACDSYACRLCSLCLHAHALTSLGPCHFIAYPRNVSLDAHRCCMCVTLTRHEPHWLIGANPGAIVALILHGTIPSNYSICVTSTAQASAMQAMVSTHNSPSNCRHCDIPRSQNPSMDALSALNHCSLLRLAPCQSSYFTLHKLHRGNTGNLFP